MTIRDQVHDAIVKAIFGCGYGLGATCEEDIADNVADALIDAGLVREPLDMGRLSNMLREYCYGEYRVGAGEAAEHIVARFGVPSAREEAQGQRVPLMRLAPRRTAPGALQGRDDHMVRLR